MGKKNEQKLQEEIDRGVYGKPLQHDANFLGPRAKRSCTDIICLLLFVCFLVAWIVVGAIAFGQGNPTKLIAPVDSDGRRCGFDAEVKDKKYLFYFDITCFLNSKNCNSPQVCVESCPSESYVGIYHIESGDISTARDKAICRGEVPDDSNGLRVAINQHRCAAWYIPFRSIGRRCIFVRKSDLENDSLIEQLLSYTDTNIDEIMDGSRSSQTASRLKKIGETIVSDLEKNWPLLVAGLAIAMVLCMIYIVIMRWFAWIIVWLSLVGVLAVLAFCCYATWVKYEEARDAQNDFESDSVIDSVVSLKITWLIFFIASCIVLVVIFIMIIFLRTRIRIAIALITEGSRAVGSVMSTLFFPLGPWIFQMGVIAWSVAVFVYLASSGLPLYEVRGVDSENCACIVNGNTYQNKDSCEPAEFNKDCSETIGQCGDLSCSFAEYESRSYTGYLHAVNIVGFFWILCFISAFSDMALAGTFSTWYWTFKKSDVPFLTLTYSVGRAVRYHIGTLAFGSLILAICGLIRVTLEFIDAKLRAYNNGFTKALLCCFKCFFWCLEKFIKFINRNAYIMCSIHGKNFCRSARKGFNLVMRNIIRVFVLDKVTDFLFLLGKLLITGGMVALAFYIFSNSLTVDEDEGIPEYTYYLLPVIIVGVGTYFVTSIFFSVYAMAVDTLFLCFLEDLERNDGSVEKPYYMSKNLMSILGKKNKKYKERLE